MQTVVVKDSYHLQRLPPGVWIIIRPDGALCMQATIEYGKDTAELPGTYVKVADISAVDKALEKHNGASGVGEADSKGRMARGSGAGSVVEVPNRGAAVRRDTPRRRLLR